MPTMISEPPPVTTEAPTYVCDGCGPGVLQEGKVYCCDACARDAQRAVPKAMRTPLLAAVCLGLGTWLGVALR